MRSFAIDVLGLRIAEHDSEDFVELVTADGSRLELFDGRAADENPVLFEANAVVAGLLVDDIQAAQDELERTPGVELIGRAKTIAGGYSWLQFRAPDGHVYELVADPDA
jgi:hypothetical protein